jgi:tight adherence protein C
MTDILNQVAEYLQVDPRYLILSGLFAGSFLVFFAIVGTLRTGAEDHAGRRMRAAGGAAQAAGILSGPERDPSGLEQAFLPSDLRERGKFRRDLAHAGFRGPNAVLAYFAIRIGLGLVLPVLLAAVVLFHHALPLPDGVRAALGRIDRTQLLVGFALLIVLGFYGPAVWLSARASERRVRAEAEFPNALDLLQVSIEAGLGFDAALSRVAAEMAVASPELSTEFGVAQQEILAGRDREHAYRRMAERIGIDEAHAFINVVLQSMRFGTSMSQALLAYSSDMRQRREIRAQEKANKLPVYMSAVMAGLMMPALLIVTIGPVVLRYTSTFGN